MAESNTQMRRSFSMPVKPLHLEPKTLKRSAEKETVYATDDSEGDEDDDANYLRQRSSPAIVADHVRSDNAEPPTLLRGLPKHLRSVRDFIANSMFLIYSIFRKSNANENVNENARKHENESGMQGNVSEECSIRTKDTDGQMNTINNDLAPESGNGSATRDENAKESEQSNENERERVVFSL